MDRGVTNNLFMIFVADIIVDSFHWKTFRWQGQKDFVCWHWSGKTQWIARVRGVTAEKIIGSNF